VRVRDYIIVAPPSRVPALSVIRSTVADYYGIHLKDMMSPRRARAVAYPRQMAMYLSKDLTDKSLPAIGRMFDRDHTTVLHAVRAVEQRIVADQDVADDVTALRGRLAA
jgi:chromosomal replication initiator protein